MFSNKILDEMNVQIKEELYSSYLYLAMAAHFEAANLPGFASWMRLQAEEERTHGMKFFDHILDRGGKVALQAIDQPPTDFGTPLVIFEQVLKHEQHVTARIHKLYGLAVDEKDFATQVFLNWFVEEQVEEEKNATTILETLKLIGEKSNAIFQLDHRLGKRGAE